jgi:hypothetical protein
MWGCPSGHPCPEGTSVQLLIWTSLRFKQRLKAAGGKNGTGPGLEMDQKMRRDPSPHRGPVPRSINGYAIPDFIRLSSPNNASSLCRNRVIRLPASYQSEYSLSGRQRLLLLVAERWQLLQTYTCSLTISLYSFRFESGEYSQTFLEDLLWESFCSGILRLPCFLENAGENIKLPSIDVKQVRMIMAPKAEFIPGIRGNVDVLI